jgi:hypothetical protein
MSRKAYGRQHLAAFAAGFIDANGLTPVGFGCQLTRIAQGHYGVLLGEVNGLSSGLVDNESFTTVTVKGTTAKYKSVVDDPSNLALKTIRIFDTSAPPTNSDADIEVTVYRSVTR